MASANVGDCLSGAWGAFKKNVLTHVVCTLLVMVVAGISAGLLAGPMVVGYMRMIEREARGEVVQIGDVFRGFDDFVPAFVAGLISSLVVWRGVVVAAAPASSLACWSWHCRPWRCTWWRVASAMAWRPSTRPGAS